MHGNPGRNIERGDRIGCVCRNCGERYTYVEKVDQDPPRSTTRCSDCHREYQRISDATVAGTWRIRSEDVREELISTIEENTRFETFVEERVNDVYVIDPEKLEEHHG